MKNVLRTIEETEGGRLTDTIKKLFLLSDTLARYTSNILLTALIVTLTSHLDICFTGTLIFDFPLTGNMLVFLLWPSIRLKQERKGLYKSNYICIIYMFLYQGLTGER